MIFVDRIRSTQASFEGYSFYHLRKDECKTGNLMRHLLGRVVQVCLYQPFLCNHNLGSHRNRKWVRRLQFEMVDQNRTMENYGNSELNGGL